MEGEFNDIEDPTPHIERENEKNTVGDGKNTVLETVDNEKHTVPETIHAESLTGSLTEVEEKIVCGQCLTGDIINERKRCRQCLEKQATKMLKLSNKKFSEGQVGTTVRVPIISISTLSSPLWLLSLMIGQECQH
ncbi:hypothetical protein FQA39_LY05429 [Lamprigera yunnana]|nr:hypothetical protein FQA39_LY05429 [Lamprigera yunnana]